MTHMYAYNKLLKSFFFFFLLCTLSSCEDGGDKDQIEKDPIEKDPIEKMKELLRNFDPNAEDLVETQEESKTEESDENLIDDDAGRDHGADDEGYLGEDEIFKRKAIERAREKGSNSNIYNQDLIAAARFEAVFNGMTVQEWLKAIGETHKDNVLIYVHGDSSVQKGKEIEAWLKSELKFKQKEIYFVNLQVPYGYSAKNRQVKSKIQEATEEIKKRSGLGDFPKVFIGEIYSGNSIESMKTLMKGLESPGNQDLKRLTRGISGERDFKDTLKKSPIVLLSKIDDRLSEFCFKDLAVLDPNHKWHSIYNIHSKGKLNKLYNPNVPIDEKIRLASASIVTSFQIELKDIPAVFVMEQNIGSYGSLVAIIGSTIDENQKVFRKFHFYTDKHNDWFSWIPNKTAKNLCGFPKGTMGYLISSGLFTIRNTENNKKDTNKETKEQVQTAICYFLNDYVRANGHQVI